jgi:hypothetical protein
MPMGQKVKQNKESQNHKDQDRVTKEKTDLSLPTGHGSLPAPRHIDNIHKEEETCDGKIVNNIPRIDDSPLDTVKVPAESHEGKEGSPEFREIREDNVLSQNEKDKG